MRWNLRMKAAERGIWKSTEMRRRLAEAGLEISAGKMSALWTGTPTTIRLDDLDVICAVLECAPADLLICEPDKVAARRPARAQAGFARAGHPAAGAAPVGAPGMTGAMRMCQVCGIAAAGDAGDPVLLRRAGPAARSPRRRAASAARREDYYTSGLCARCHTRAPGQRSPPGRPAGATVVIDSCPDCCGWGVTRTYRLALRGLQGVAGSSTRPGQCATCGRRDRGRPTTASCRLCRKQRSHARRPRRHPDRPGQPGRRPTARPAAVLRRRRHVPPGRARQAPVRRRRPSRRTCACCARWPHRQLVLLDWPRDLRAGLRLRVPAAARPGPGGGVRASSSASTPPATAGPRARPSASSARSGSCSASRTPRARRSGAATWRCCPGSSTRPRSSPMCWPRPGCWRKTATRRGALVPRGDRGPARPDAARAGRLVRRHAPRLGHPAAVPASLAIPRPTASCGGRCPRCASGRSQHESLREIGRDDVLAVLPPPATPRGHACGRACGRSSGILKGRKLVFVNPAARISAPQPARQRRRRSTWTRCAPRWTPPTRPAPRWPPCWPSTRCASTSCARCG